MIVNSRKKCPICFNFAKSNVFPYATIFNHEKFTYLKCQECETTYVDPTPSSQTFKLMYSKVEYHDNFYDGNDMIYQKSIYLLNNFLAKGSLVLDYGCGLGGFLKALNNEGYTPYGVEFDADAAEFASLNAKCKVYTIDNFIEHVNKPIFDAIYLGDVLEHLPDPSYTLKWLLQFLKPGGILFIEGPLEKNPSLVYLSAKIFGFIKKLINPNFVGTHPPTHLFHINAKQQLKFFYRVQLDLTLEYWEVYETGWPYLKGGFLKNLIATLAIKLSGTNLLSTTLGNRFCGVFLTHK